MHADYSFYKDYEEVRSDLSTFESAKLQILSQILRQYILAGLN